MTTTDRLLHSVSRTAPGENVHGANAIERSGKEACTSLAHTTDRPMGLRTL